MQLLNQSFNPIHRVSNYNAVIHIRQDDAIFAKEYTGINTAWDKTMILKTITQLGKPIVPLLL
jgi:hypothetical protein